MGYPASRECLCDWIDELAPGQRKHRGPNPRREPVSVEKKVQVIAELEARMQLRRVQLELDVRQATLEIEKRPVRRT